MFSLRLYESHFNFLKIILQQLSVNPSFPQIPAQMLSLLETFLDHAIENKNRVHAQHSVALFLCFFVPHNSYLYLIFYFDLFILPLPHNTHQSVNSVRLGTFLSSI